MSCPPRPGPGVPEQHPDPSDPLEDPMVSDPQQSTERNPRGPRVGTVVWGLVIAAIGVGILAWTAGLVFDVELALIVLVAAAGVALLVGSLITGLRRSGR